MRYAADFRSIARDALRGRWVVAVIAGVIAALLGGLSSGGPEVNLEFGDNGASVNLEIANQTIFSLTEGIPEGLKAFLVGSAALIIIVALVVAVVMFVVGGVVGVGYAQFNLDLVDRQPDIQLSTLFGHFSHWKGIACANLIRSLYVLLWSLLLIVPGIVASYSCAMTNYILAENPDMPASEAVGLSKAIMQGNRWRLFCLQCSFIGWSILCAFTFGIGNFVLTPYVQAATAAFYREVSGTEHMAAPETDIME